MAITLNSTVGKKAILHTSSGDYTLREVYFNDVKVLGEVVALIPVMTSNTAPSGTVTYKNRASTGSDGYKAFDNNTATGYLGRASGETTSVHNEQFLQYEFDTAVSVDHVTVLVAESDYTGKTYDVTLYLDLIDSAGNILTTLSKELAAADAKVTQTIKADTLISDVKAIKLYFNKRTVQNSASSTVYHISCAEMQAYGYK